MKKTKVFNIICAVIMLLFFVLQYTPYWRFTTEAGASKSANIRTYNMNPEGNKDFTAWLTPQMDSGFRMGDGKGWGIVLWFLLIAGCITCCCAAEKQGGFWVSLAAALCGILSISRPAMKLGSAHGWHVFFYILLIVMAVIGLCVHAKEKKE